MHNPQFYLKLDNDEIILHGTAEESGGVVLRGSVTLNCLEQTKIKTITLKFLGTSKAHWTEGVGANARHFKQEHKLVEKYWVFLAPQKKPYQLSPGTYTWEFELPLPGNLLETMNHNLGQVSYRFKAYCERPTFSTNLVSKKTLKVKRLILPSCVELFQPVIIANTWADKIAYDISIPSKVFSGNTSLPISFDLTPIASNLRIKSMRCCLKEYVTFTAQGRSKMEGRVIQYYRDDDLVTDSANGHLSKIVILHVPEESNEIIFDMSGELIQVKHKLKFTIALENSDGHISELRASIPLILSSIVPDDDGNALPAYEDAIRAVPYTEETVTQLIAMGEIPALSDSNLSVSSSLNRVPSYTTALRSSEPCDLQYPSLPNYYESISIA